ncbi:alpha-L-arabinofuranosidase [Asticcacaulis sp. DW145]|uniref:non-reducing end alpha-L-arabinofuranosidase n=1 Tax=Asticcacaulis currens TaxID=2984210 RepID=A0ABT5IHS3_9CAUL|nr:alpha-L-arabinofuranosidase C-terminal domain-containing protein [Asticcacaulis currens]MDC7695679.1 alpha-L-arabinofuranosidase C-terminal domain-containing protein [Asticcacaulis currens]BEV11772.1 alpha-L-arabinofuranosidase [Asticcacaulis sp. DW145]
MKPLVLTGVLSLLALTLPAAAQERVSVTVDATKPGAKIDRRIFGQFAEHLGSGIYEGVWVGKDSAIPNTRGIRNDVVAALKAIKVPVVRWPGGCFADEYHWRRGIGPERKPMMNANWGGVIEPNTFGTDEFMDFATQVGAEAYISVNVGSGTVGEAAEWLEYMTSSTQDGIGAERARNGHAEPYKVAFVGLGNESWDCGGAMTPDFYVSQMKMYARFVRNYNKAQPMQRIAVGPSGPDTAYTEAVMKSYKGRSWAWDIEGLSLHYYTTGGGFPVSQKATGFGEKEYAVILQDTLKMDELVKTHSAIMDKYDPEKKVSLVVDEWGAWYVATPGTDPGFLMQQNTQRDAVLSALNLNIFARHADRVRMANIAQMVNVLQAMILTDKEKMLLTPTYHVFRMYVPFQDATFIPVTLNAGTYSFGDISLPRVDALAARGTDGKIYLSLTNLDPRTPVDIDVASLNIKVKTATGETLSAAKFDAYNTFSDPETVAPKPVTAKMKDGKVMVRLSPASVTVLTLQP